MKNKFILSLLFFCISSVASAQHKSEDIPLIEVSDFEAEVPEDARMPIYINSRIYYHIDTVIKKRRFYRVGIRTTVEMQKNESFWDHEKVKPKDEAKMLEHEQGHFYLAHIAANSIEKDMLKYKFTENWKEEVRSKFHELLRKHHNEYLAYERETRHGSDSEQQEIWNSWFKWQLK